MKRVFNYRGINCEIKYVLDHTHYLVILKDIDPKFRNILRRKNKEVKEILDLARQSGFAITISDMYDEKEKLTLELKMFHHDDIDTFDNYIYLFINFIIEQCSLPESKSISVENPWGAIKLFEKHFNALVLTPEEVLDKDKKIRFDLDFCGLNYRKIGQSKYRGRKFEFGELSGMEKYIRFEANKNDFEKIRDVKLQETVRNIVKDRLGVVLAIKVEENHMIDIRFIRSLPKYGDIRYYDIFREFIKELINREFESTEVVEFGVYSNINQYKIIINKV